MIRALVSSLALFAVAAAKNITAINPDTVDELNLDSYVGLWYQVIISSMLLTSIQTANAILCSYQ
jgi:lipocalin